MRRIDRLIERGGHASTSGFTGPVKSKAAFSQPSSLSSAPKSRPGPSSSKRKAPSPTPVSELESALSQSESEDEDGDDDNEEAAAARYSPPRTRRRTSSGKSRGAFDTAKKSKPSTSAQTKIWRKHIYYLDIPKRLPSSPPTPPPPVRLTRGYAFTDKDKTYFVNFLLWEVKSGADLTKAKICKKMSDQVSQVVLLLV